MGTANLTCCVTRTPILEKDNCVILLFKPEAADGFLDRCGGLQREFERNFVCSYRGKYKGYYKVSGCPVNNLADTNQYLPFAISQEAWEYGIEYSNSPDFKRMREHIQSMIDLNLKMQKLDAALLISNPDDKLLDNIKAINALVGSQNWIGFGQEYFIISALDTICRSNYINMFECDIYGGQSMCFKEKKAWGDLRNKRIKYLESKIKE